MTRIKIGLSGATGRMGKAIIQAIDNDKGLELSSALASHNNPLLGQKIAPNIILNDKADSLFQKADVIIDFSQPQATQLLLEKALNFKKPLVIGTTGLDRFHHELLKKISKLVPVVYSPNMSIGITVMQVVVKQLTKVLGEEYDVELSETHHRHKVDAPSGTCLMLAETVAKVRGVKLNEVASFKRHGQIGPRQKGEIGFSVKRGGQSPGEHTVSFLSDAESIELTHHSFSRDIFVNGALTAAKWAIKQPVGLYSMQDVLGI